MALQHETKLFVYKELKWVVGFEEYLYKDSFFCSSTCGFFEELSRHTKRGGSKECPNCGA